MRPKAPEPTAHPAKPAGASIASPAAKTPTPLPVETSQHEAPLASELAEAIPLANSVANGVTEAPSAPPIVSSLPKALLAHVLSVAPGGKSVFTLARGDEAPSLSFIVYYDQEEARGDRGQRAPGLVTGEYEVWASPTPDDFSTHKVVLRQHVSPGKPGGMQQCYAAEQCAAAIMARFRRS